MLELGGWAIHEGWGGSDSVLSNPLRNGSARKFTSEKFVFPKAVVAATTQKKWSDPLPHSAKFGSESSSFTPDNWGLLEFG